METKVALKLMPGKSRVRITDVDEFGFCGRDEPPDVLDTGRVCTVLEIVTDDQCAPEDLEYAIVVAVPDGQPHRRLELVNHEIEECC